MLINGEEFTFFRARHPVAARVTARRGRSGVAMTVTGEIDALNAEDLSDYVQQHAVPDEWLVLDCSGLDFMGTAGFSALHRINTRCAEIDARWALVTGAALSRLLRICDPDTRLPAMESLSAALVTVQRDCRQSA